MQSLRNALFLARIVLAWFALSIGVAVASPLVNPQAIELICSGSGAMKVLVKSADGSQAPATATLDCPLCASIAGPPPPLAGALPVPQPHGIAVQPIPCAPTAARTAAPLPARGPPSVLSI